VCAPISFVKTMSCYQDRLGTNVRRGLALKKRRVFHFSVSRRRGGEDEADARGAGYGGAPGPAVERPPHIHGRVRSSFLCSALLCSALLRCSLLLPCVLLLSCCLAVLLCCCLAICGVCFVAVPLATHSHSRAVCPLLALVCALLLRTTLYD
jgi:hypothetical protein